MADYWVIAVEEIMSDHGFNLSDSQISALAKDFEGAHQSFGELSGHDVAASNMAAMQRNEVRALEQKLQAEQEKVPCRHCRGGTLRVPGMNGEMRQADCWKCGGSGRHPA